MTFGLSLALGLLGLACLIGKRGLPGIFLGIHLLLLGATAAVVISGASSGFSEDGRVFGLFALIVGLAQVVLGFALAARLFLLKGDERVGSLRRLRN